MGAKSNLARAKKILVADDNPIILKSVSLVLRARGYRVLTAATGAEAIGAVNHDRPDLILLDLNFPPDAENVVMPLQHGFQIMDWLWEMSGVPATPVIIISADEPGEYQKATPAVRAAAAFQKPLDNARLLDAIRQALESKRANSPQITGISA